jgi:signal transduction histidine kinase/CheY-like chemotaxis protein
MSDSAELYRRLALLVKASGSLLESPETASVHSATLSLAKELLVADGYAIWAGTPTTREWRVETYQGISPRFADRLIAASEAIPGAMGFTVPLPIPDVEEQPLIARQLEAYREEGIRSILVCPMPLVDQRAASLVFYYRTAHAFSEMDVQTAQALANLSAVATKTANLHNDHRIQHQSAEDARKRAVFMADATAILSRSLDFEQTLAAVAQLAVPEMADWCAVDMFDSSHRLRRLAVAHVDPAKVRFARALEEKYPSDPNARGGVQEVIRTGKPTMMTTIPPELLAAAAARDDETRRILDELALTSYLCVPLTTVGGTIGALTFVFAESGRHYTQADLAFAQDLAGRAALAIDNASAYSRAHEANRLKDAFLATLSHELRTPLNAILGYAQMLNVGALKAKDRSNAITVLTRNAKALRQIIDDVLDVSRIVSGKLRLNVSPVALDGILRNAADSVQPAADAKGVALQLVLDPEAPPVSGDPDRLQQVVWNLLANAVKFTPRGGHVQLRLSREESSVVITVSDDGRGIEPSFLPHVFERFRQADSRFSREHGGLGLGLTIARELVALHGGDISASSDGPGTGATFTIRLPPMIVHRGAATEPVAWSQPSSDPLKGFPEQLKNTRILAVDDEEDARDLLRGILESAGAEVTTADSARRALELLENASYDLLIADIGMPQMDGLQFIRTVRHRLPARVNRVPAAALTAYARADDRITALASGFQIHIAKPVDPIELVFAMAALLGRSS